LSTVYRKYIIIIIIIIIILDGPGIEYLSI